MLLNKLKELPKEEEKFELIDRDALEKKIKFFTTEAWKYEINTSVNSIVEYILRSTMYHLLDHLEPQLDDIITTLNKLLQENEFLQKKVLEFETQLKNLKEKELKDGEERRNADAERYSETRSTGSTRKSNVNARGISRNGNAGNEEGRIVE